jgi:2-polyprenyl-3-methyl-5-hydroxy-6-metoxy-1,4-benzoquinol methylase
MRSDPASFYRALNRTAVEYLERMGVPLSGARWLDVGTGTGAMPEALAWAGAVPVAVDVEDLRLPELPGGPFVRGRAERLPFRTESFDGVMSSNVLEHMSSPQAMVAELVRVCRPGGHVFLSWTNWYSPWGGHEMTPFHYLGPSLGMRTYRAVSGHPPRENVPGQTLFVVHVGQVLRMLRRMDVRILDVAPRYWPSLRLLARVPGLREVALWNCVILLQKPPGVAAARASR